MQEKGILLIISGPSGAGKGTVVNSLINQDDYALSISATTRSPRVNEENGVHYFFKEVEEFKKMIEEDKFIEHACFCDNYYGTPKEYVENKLKDGYNVILEIEVQGALQVKEKLDDVVLIFLIPPSIEELRNRLEGRGTEEKDVIDKRINRAKEEIEFLPQYDYVVVNETIEDAVKDINNIVKAEKLKAGCNLELIEVFKGEKI